MKDLDGICILNSIAWGPDDADLIIYCDACPSGLGFYCPSFNIGSCSQITDATRSKTIFFLEAICVASALAWASSHLQFVPRCLLIYSDSMDTVEIFHSMQGKSEDYNAIVFFMVEILLQMKLSLRVFHIPGTENGVADALSCLLLDVALTLHPYLDVRSFQPPQLAMGAAK